LFCTARWKAYLVNIQKRENDSPDEQNIYDIYHSQMIWFTRADSDKHNEAASEHLKRADELLDDCTNMVDNLEETLANTPKPSKVLDWSRLW
jgi:hypothetical protein